MLDYFIHNWHGRVVDKLILPYLRKSGGGSARDLRPPRDLQLIAWGATLTCYDCTHRQAMVMVVGGKCSVHQVVFIRFFLDFLSSSRGPHGVWRNLIQWFFDF
jgi:hypothetical protein